MTHILLVEDDTSISALFARMLNRLGHTVQVACDGYSALALLDTEPFNLLITDLDLPQLSGTALIQLLAKRPHRPPILVASGNTLPRDIAGLVDGVIAKPFQLTELKEKIAQLFPSTDGRLSL